MKTVITCSSIFNVFKSRFFTVFLFAVFLTSGFAAEVPDGKWVATWGASPFVFRSFNNAPPPPPFKDQTVRQVLRISVGGDMVRVRFSNVLGTEPLVIGAATVAVVADGASVNKDSIRTLTFGGETSITVPAGAPVLSDPVTLAVDDLDELAISMYLPQETPPGTVHMGRISYRSSAGDHTGSVDLPGAEQSATMVFLTGVYVHTSGDTNVVVALGDSITDGAASTPYTFNSWPDHLAQRLANRSGNNKKVAVVNHGISGNQLLRPGAGDATLGRFDRDVLATPGLSHVVVLIGINDIGTGGMQFPGATGPAPAMRTPEDLIAGYRQIIARVRSASPSIKVYGATLTPFEGTFPGYYSPEKDQIRMQVNEWIRTSGEYDAVIDFDKAIQDPDQPTRMKAEYDSGDKLHPGDAGYKRMADSIDLTLFK